MAENLLHVNPIEFIRWYRSSSPRFCFLGNGCVCSPVPTFLCCFELWYISRHDEIHRLRLCGKRRCFILSFVSWLFIIPCCLFVMLVSKADVQELGNAVQFHARHQMELRRAAPLHHRTTDHWKLARLYSNGLSNDVQKHILIRYGQTNFSSLLISWTKQ